MSTPTHIISCSLITYAAVKGFVPHNVDLPVLLGSLIPPALIDLDHVYYVLKNPQYFKDNRKKAVFHLARSPFHELLGVALVGIIALFVLRGSVAIAQAIFISFTLHLLEDMILGKSFPLVPWDKTLISPFNLTRNAKIRIELTVLFGSLILWTIYLSEILI